MTDGGKKPWFPAKRYGWGWDMPNCWQGWIVLAAYLALLFVGILLFLPSKHIGLLIGYFAVLSILLCAIFWFKGEKPRWRWGGGFAADSRGGEQANRREKGEAL